jgi:hypothetical protein
MTINARKGHSSRGRGYTNKYAACRQVKLDGALRPNAFYADGRRGVVREYAVDAQGRKYLDPKTGEPATRELRGRVTWVRLG